MRACTYARFPGAPETFYSIHSISDLSLDEALPAEPSDDTEGKLQRHSEWYLVGRQQTFLVVESHEVGIDTNRCNTRTF